MLSFIKKLPVAALFFLAVEFSERASYYGYRSILMPYLRFELGFSKERATEIIRSNIALTYVMPVLGGLLADWFFGKYLTIVGFALICCLGHLLLALSMHFDAFPMLHLLFDDGLGVFQAGLFCIACGAGGLKPNNTGMFGDQFQGDRQAQIENAFRWFYTSINVGSLLANIGVPLVKNTWSYDWGFGVPGLLMLASAIFLVWGRKYYFHVPPVGLPKTTFVSFNLHALWLWLRGTPKLWQMLVGKFGEKTAEYQVSIWRVTAYFLFFAVAWAVYDMNGAEWVEEARYLDRRLWGFEVPFESVQTVNPFFIIVLAPLAVLFFNWLRDRGVDFPMRRQVFWGMLLLIVAALIEGSIKIGIENWLDANPAMREPKYADAHPEFFSSISAWWQVLAYFVLTAGEVLFSIAGLTLGFRYAPPKMKASVLAAWYLSTATGNYVAAAVNSLMGEGQVLHFLTNGGNYYWFFCLLLTVNAALYYWITPLIPEKMYDTAEE